MRASRWFLASMTGLAAMGGCLRSADPILPTTDVIFVESVVVAGRSRAYMLVGNPQGAAPPVVDATLSGSGWTAAFSETVDVYWCGVRAPDWWPGPVECRRARLPEPIRESTRYTLAGTTPMGPFSGQTVVPRAPVVHQPADTVHVRIASGRERVELTLRFETPSEVGSLAVEPFRAVQILDDGTQEHSTVSGVFPSYLAVGSGSAEVAIHGHWESPEFRVSLRLIGFEENYSRFMEVVGDDTELLGHPWPSFGLEGVIGYFGGGAPSRAIPVVMRIE